MKSDVEDVLRSTLRDETATVRVQPDLASRVRRRVARRRQALAALSLVLLVGAGLLTKAAWPAGGAVDSVRPAGPATGVPASALSLGLPCVSSASAIGSKARITTPVTNSGHSDVTVESFRMHGTGLRLSDVQMSTSSSCTGGSAHPFSPVTLGPGQTSHAVTFVLTRGDCHDRALAVDVTVRAAQATSVQTLSLPSALQSTADLVRSLCP